MYQELTIAGNLGGDPEMRFTPSGTAVTNFSVATNRQYTASDGSKVKETTWFRVSAWGKMAEITNQYLRKGSKVLVVGRLISDQTTGGPRIWNRQDGSSAASFEVNASEVRFLGDSNGNGREYSEPSGQSEPESEIPF